METRNDSINLAQHTMTVRHLKEVLSRLDDDLPVVLASDYGDHTHTTQLMRIDAVHLIDAKNIEDSGYSESGAAYYRDEYVEEQYDDALTALRQICVIRTPSVNCEDVWEMPEVGG